MKVIVTGASGLLGRAVFQAFDKKGHATVGTAYSRAPANSQSIVKVDLRDWDALQRFLESEKPDVIIHTAAERRPDVVEREPAASHELNVVVPERIAEWCAANAGSPLLVNISTDYVFDGRKPPYSVDDEPNPLNAYGKSKLDGERGVLAKGKAGRVTNVRVPVLYGRTESNDESAVNVLLDAVQGGPSLHSSKKKMDANATRYPTNVDDVANALVQLSQLFGGERSAAHALPPTLHFSAPEAMTKYDMSLTMARCLREAAKEASTEHLVPEHEVDPNAATSRPQNCQLDVSMLKELGVDVTCVPFYEWWKVYLSGDKHAV